MKKLTLFFVLTLLVTGISFSQSDATAESKMHQSGTRIVSGDENRYSSHSEQSKIPSNLLQQYKSAGELKNENLTAEIEKYLDKPLVNGSSHGMKITTAPPFESDWYNSDVLISNSEIVNNGSYRQIDLKQGEDGWLYLAINRRNTSTSGHLTVYRSSNGGATWFGIISVTSSGYYSSISMIVESRNNSVPDSTRILLYSTHSMSSNYNDAGLYCVSFRRDGSASDIFHVASPTAGNRFVNVSACSDGMYYSSATYMHVVVREETNAGTFASMHHYRSTTWGVSHTVGTFNTFSDDRYPVCAFSRENGGTDSIYIAVERVISANEREIRLIAVPEVPSANYSIRYITDAAPGTIYERPSITIQQRHFSLPQNILVTCTKDKRAVYHFSTDGGAFWATDYNLGLITQSVDYTSCSSDSLDAGGKDFIAAFVNLAGDSVSVRNGQLGSMGPLQHKRNSVPGTGVLAPSCAIYKTGSNKYSAFAYVGYGPTGVYYNMETLVTGIQQTGSEVPNGFSLEQNYPNPFNPVTNIKFSVPKAGNVTLKVYDISGREVAQLLSQNLNAGTFNYDFDASHLSTGVYFYRLTAEGFTDVKKMMLIK